MPIVLLGTKCDVVENRKVKRDELEELAKAWDIPYIEVSAKVDINIDIAIKTMLSESEKAKSNGFKKCPDKLTSS